MVMTEEEHYREAYRLFSRDFMDEHQESPINIWGFVNVLPDDIRDRYMGKAKVTFRRKKLIKLKNRIYEGR